jgi:hypothetical protein
MLIASYDIEVVTPLCDLGAASFMVRNIGLTARRIFVLCGKFLIKGSNNCEEINHCHDRSGSFLWARPYPLSYKGALRTSLPVSPPLLRFGDASLVGLI